MSGLPKITVVTPSFNQGDFINVTLQSVLSQNYPNLEYIVLDGGSTDGTLDVLRRYDGKLVWRSEKDRGQSDALNKGMRMATGEVVCFLNSDDLFEPGALLRVGQYFADHPQDSWLTGRCRTIDSKGVEIRKPITMYKNFWLCFRSYSVLLVLNYISQPATFWRRKVLDEAGLFDESLHYAMEYDFWLRVGKKFKLNTVNDYLASFRVHPASKAGASASAQFDAELEIAKRYTTSPFLLGAHRLHRYLVVATYRQLLTKGR